MYVNARISYEKNRVGIKATVFKRRIFTRSQRTMKLFSLQKDFCLWKCL